MRPLLPFGAGLLLAATAAAAAAQYDEPLPMLRRRSGPITAARRVLDEDDMSRSAPATLGDDASRPAWVYYPQAYNQADDETLWPLVLMIHGGGSDSYYHDRLLGVSARVDSHGFVALLPNGTVNSHGLRFWNGIRCCDFDHNGVDDVGYLTGLIKEATEKLRIDPKRVYIIGHSNGGVRVFAISVIYTFIYIAPIDPS